MMCCHKKECECYDVTVLRNCREGSVLNCKDGEGYFAEETFTRIGKDIWIGPNPEFVYFDNKLRKFEERV